MKAYINPKGNGRHAAEYRITRLKTKFRRSFAKAARQAAKRDLAQYN